MDDPVQLGLRGTMAHKVSECTQAFAHTNYLQRAACKTPQMTEKLFRDAKVQFSPGLLKAFRVPVPSSFFSQLSSERNSFWIKYMIRLEKPGEPSVLYAGSATN